jgi:hypothetical protein
MVWKRTIGSRVIWRSRSSRRTKPASRCGPAGRVRTILQTDSLSTSTPRGQAYRVDSDRWPSMTRDSSASSPVDDFKSVSQRISEASLSNDYFPLLKLLGVDNTSQQSPHYSAASNRACRAALIGSESGPGSRNRPAAVPHAAGLTSPMRPWARCPAIPLNEYIRCGNTRTLLPCREA